MSAFSSPPGGCCCLGGYLSLSGGGSAIPGSVTLNKSWWVNHYALVTVGDADDHAIWSAMGFDWPSYTLSSTIRFAVDPQITGPTPPTGMSDTSILCHDLTQVSDDGHTNITEQFDYDPTDDGTWYPIESTPSDTGGWYHLLYDRNNLPFGEAVIFDETGTNTYTSASNTLNLDAELAAVDELGNLWLAGGNSSASLQFNDDAVSMTGTGLSFTHTWAVAPLGNYRALVAGQSFGNTTVDQWALVTITDPTPGSITYTVEPITLVNASGEALWLGVADGLTGSTNPGVAMKLSNYDGRVHATWTIGTTQNISAINPSDWAVHKIIGSSGESGKPVLIPDEAVIL